MATYKTLDLMNRISQILNNGYFFVDVSEIEGDSEFSTSLSFEAEDGNIGIGYDDVDSISDNEESTFITSDDYIAAFTANEISLLHHSVSNALEYYKECLNDPSYSRETKDKIKADIVQTRNMQAKLLKLINPFKK